MLENNTQVVNISVINFKAKMFSQIFLLGLSAKNIIAYCTIPLKNKLRGKNLIDGCAWYRSRCAVVSGDEQGRNFHGMLRELDVTAFIIALGLL